MSQVDRRHYCPSGDPYLDAPHAIGYGATISAPHMHAYALEYVKDKLVEGAKVLDVGSGSGYLTACFGHMVGSTGVAYGVEHIKELVETSLQSLKRDCPELLDSGRVKIVLADGRLGLPEHAPYDVIHVGARAENLPETLVEQLKEGGRMILPVGRGDLEMFESVDKLPGGKLERNDLLTVRYIPLTDVKSQLDGARDLVARITNKTVSP